MDSQGRILAMIGVVGRLQMSLLKSILVTVCLSVQALAGHDVMVHLAIYNDGPFKVEKVPAVFGVPFPSSDDPVELTDLILAGADTFQVRPLSHWPNGSIRWLMIEAIVNVQANADRAIVHLTTGQSPIHKHDLAKEIPNGYLIDTGQYILKYEKGEKIICKLEQIEGEEVPELLIQLSSENEKLGTPRSSQLLLKNNGPATATVAVIEQYELDGIHLELTRTCKFFKGHKRIVVDSALRRLYSYPELSVVQNVYPNLELANFYKLNIHQDSTWIERSEKGIHNFITGDINIQIRTAWNTADESSDVGSKQKWLSRVRHEIDLLSGTDTPDIATPFVGRAVSHHTYNDSRSLGAYVMNESSESPVDLSLSLASTTGISKTLYNIMGGKLLPKPAVVRAIDQWMSNFDLRFHPELYSLWYFLTGDVVLHDMRDEMAFKFRPPDIWDSHAKTHILWDNYLLNSSIKLRDEILDNIENFFDKDQGMIPPQVSPPQFLVQIIRQGGLTGTKLGEWLDRLEWQIHQSHSMERYNGIYFAEGYRLTGEKEFLEKGKKWLEESARTDHEKNAINGMIKNIQRQYIWRWLPVNAKNLGEKGWELSWKTPKNVVRYRLKQSNKQIKNIPNNADDLTTTSFHVADNLFIDVNLQSPGSLQTIQIPKSTTKNNQHFALRYLERGPNLPTPKNALQTESNESENQVTAQSLATTLIKYFMIALVSLVLLVLLILAKKFI